MKKKIIKKKLVKKVIKKKPAKKVVSAKGGSSKGGKKSIKKKVIAKPKTAKKLGEVTHFYGGISVAIIKCAEVLKVGQKVRVKGATTDFVCTIDSIQYEHAPLSASKKGQEVGVKVSDKVRGGDEIFFVE